MQKYTASFLGKDCPGVVATVSRLLGEAGCNIVEVSQTILAGQFAAIFAVQAPDGLQPDLLRLQLGEGLQAAGVDLSVLGCVRLRTNTGAAGPIVSLLSSAWTDRINRVLSLS